MADLSSGAVTFLFTDVEGSTRLLKQLRERYGEVLATHQRLLEMAFDRHGGRVVDTQGDSFFVVFGNAREAVLAAIDAQRALSEHEWPEGADLRVRMGIHSGQAAASEKTYLGLAVHRAARISASGHGGQILVSQTTQNLLEDEEETSGVELRDLGEQRLKDLDRPVRVYQVAAEGLEREFPPLRTNAPSPEVELVRRSPRRRAILAGALTAVIAAAVAIPIFAFGGGSGGGGLGDATGNAIGSIGAETGDVEGGVELPGTPTAVAVGLGSVWAVSGDSNQVYAIDLDTNNVETIDVGNAPAGIAVGGGLVWVTNSDDGTVMQISPQGRILDEIKVGNSPTGIAFDKERGYVWVVKTADHTVSNLDASTGKLLKTYSAGADPVAVAVGERAIWIASKSGNTVTRLRPGSSQVLKRIPVGRGPAAVAVGIGSVWVANSDDGTVWQIDPADGSLLDSIKVGSGPTGIAIVGGDVWTTDEFSGAVSRIDPATNEATSVELESAPTAVADGDETLYVALRPTGRAHRGGTLTVAVGVDISLTTLDPAVLSYSELSQFVRLTNDGLLTYRHVGGQAGTELVGDLAVARPDPSPDGKSYTFQLRRNVKYSNGVPVRARDFRYAIERVFKLRPRAGDPGIFLGIRGAERCARPKSRLRCNLSAGVETDDAARTVTFHLTSPNPYFLYNLASSQAEVVPFGTSMHEAKRRPLPATGPYRVASFTPLSVRLVRNRRFHEWSKAAQPAGFPDEIVLQGVPAEKNPIALVEDGKADLTGVGGDVPPRLRPLVHAIPALFTLYLALNIHRPPFDDPKARRAVNYAVDRNKVVRLKGGEDVARPTCQVLPPNFPGYRRYCPYTLYPGADGSWTAPDTVKATRLIAESGTAGTHVTLWMPTFAGAGLARYLRELLESLHYRVGVRSSFGPFAPLSKDENKDPFFRYFERLGSGVLSKRRGSPQIAWDGWGADYPAASSFIQPLFSCGSKSVNKARFCDPAFERRMRRAAQLEQTEPAIANRRWAELDREITDKAVVVPLYNSYGADLVSKRVGNYQYNPQFGPLLSQMWVR